MAIDSEPQKTYKNLFWLLTTLLNYSLFNNLKFKIFYIFFKKVIFLNWFFFNSTHLYNAKKVPNKTSFGRRIKKPYIIHFYESMQNVVADTTLLLKIVNYEKNKKISILQWGSTAKCYFISNHYTYQNLQKSILLVKMKKKQVFIVNKWDEMIISRWMTLK